MISGHATAEATEKYASRFPDMRYTLLGRTGLHVSQAGFGSYRVDASFPAHHQALTRALQGGVNLIDTSANYADGGSEKLIGAVMAEAGMAREEIAVVSKVGYLQGQNYELSIGRKQAGRPFPDIVEYADGLEHCIHPEFIEDQLTRSLDRLGMETIDVYLLHNPEYYLGWAHKHGVELAKARDEYLRRIGEAFRHMEREVARGRIQFYGISSNTFPHAADDPEFTSLERAWEIAESISKDHRFRVIQFPMNLFEHGAATEVNQSGGRTLLEFASEKNLGVLINRPLNAIYNNGMVRLSDQNVRAVEPLRGLISTADVEWAAAGTLSQAAVRALRSTTGIHCVLVGMRRETYVDDVLTELRNPMETRDRKSSWSKIKGAIERG